MPAKKGSKASKSPRSSWTLDRRVAILGVICGIGAVGLMASRQLPPRSDVVAATPASANTQQADSSARDISLRTVPPVAGVKPVQVAAVAEPVGPMPPAPVTISGCLEQGDETFWLKDVSGADTPTSRSWKSGFLKRRPSRIEVVDAVNALKLSRYVGQRIAATGTLVDREIETRSVRAVAGACS
jgi:hypothetical protein